MSTPPSPERTSFRMDRTAFRAQTAQAADRRVAFWRTRPVSERLRAAGFLIGQAYNLPDYFAHRMDRSVSRIKYRRMANNIFNSDFQDFIKALNTAEVRYVLVGGYAVIVHGYNRTTGDMDIWVEPTQANYDRLLSAFAEFGMPTFDMTESKFLQTEAYDVFTFGLPPSAIDLMTQVKGLSFPAAYAASSLHEFEDLSVRVVSYRDLLTAKRASARLRDLNDVEQLEAGDE